MKKTSQMYRLLADLYEGDPNITPTELAREFQRKKRETLETDDTIVGMMFKLMEPHIFNQYYRWKNLDNDYFVSQVNWALNYSLNNFEKENLRKKVTYQSYFYTCLLSSLHKIFIDDSKSNSYYVLNTNATEENNEPKKIKVTCSHFSLDDDENGEQVANKDISGSIEEIEANYNLSRIRDKFDKDSGEYALVDMLIDKSIYGDEEDKYKKEKLSEYLGKPISYFGYKRILSNLQCTYINFKNSEINICRK